MSTAKQESLPNHWSSWGDLDFLVKQLRLHPCLRPEAIVDGFDEPTDEERRLIEATLREHLEHD